MIKKVSLKEENKKRDKLKNSNYNFPRMTKYANEIFFRIKYTKYNYINNGI